jgi:hypothetical protein
VAIKGGQIIHAGNGNVVIDRVQTGGPGQVNIPTEKINELGNYKSVATVRDTPDLTFSLESWDVSPEVELLLAGRTTVPGTGIDMSTVVPIDMASQFKAGLDAADPFAVVQSVALPYLSLESMSYRFGLRDNASQSASLRGDTIFYNPGPTFVETTSGTNTANQTVATAHPAYQSAEGDGRHVLSVRAGSKRLNLGPDYSEAVGTATNGAAISTLTIHAPVPTSTKIVIVYSSPDAVSYPQTVHADTTVKPAAVKGRDIDIYVGGYDPLDLPGSQANKLSSVQSVNVDWRVNIDRDEEFGNYYAVAVDHADVPDVSGSVDIKPRDPADLMALLRKFTGVSDVRKALGAASSVPLPLDVVIKDPADSSTVVKRLHVPNARFLVPGYSGRVIQKTTITVNFSDDAGDLFVF